MLSGFTHLPTPHLPGSMLIYLRVSSQWYSLSIIPIRWSQWCLIIPRSMSLVAKFLASWNQHEWFIPPIDGEKLGMVDGIVLPTLIMFEQQRIIWSQLSSLFIILWSIWILLSIIIPIIWANYNTSLTWNNAFFSDDSSY